MTQTDKPHTCGCGTAMYPLRSKKNPADVLYICLRCDAGMQRQ